MIFFFFILICSKPYEFLECFLTNEKNLHVNACNLSRVLGLRFHTDSTSTQGKSMIREGLLRCHWNSVQLDDTTARLWAKMKTVSSIDRPVCRDWNSVQWSSASSIATTHSIQRYHPLLSRVTMDERKWRDGKEWEKSLENVSQVQQVARGCRLREPRIRREPTSSRSIDRFSAMHVHVIDAGYARQRCGCASSSSCFWTFFIAERTLLHCYCKFELWHLRWVQLSRSSSNWSTTAQQQLQKQRKSQTWCSVCKKNCRL